MAAKPTPASAWKAKPELVELPSGKHVRLREKVNIYALLRAGVLTLEMVEDWQAVQRGELKDLARAMALQDALVAWLFIEPRCVLNGAVAKDAIHVQDLDDADLDFLIARAFGGAPEDGTFPESARDAAALSGGDRAGGDSSEVEPEPEPAARAGAGNSGGVSRGSPARSKPATARKRAARKR